MSNIPNLSPLRLAYLNKRVRTAEAVIPDSLDTMKRAYVRGMNLIWTQEADIGPDEVIEALGTSAASLFAEGARLLAFILAIDPDWSYPTPTRTFTINEDGTVTVDPAPEPEPQEE